MRFLRNGILIYEIRSPVHSGNELIVKLGLKANEQLPLEGFDVIEIDGRRYMCLPANTVLASIDYWASVNTAGASSLLAY